MGNNLFRDCTAGTGRRMAALACLPAIRSNEMVRAGLAASSIACSMPVDAGPVFRLTIRRPVL